MAATSRDAMVARFPPYTRTATSCLVQSVRFFTSTLFTVVLCTNEAVLCFSPWPSLGLEFVLVLSDFEL